MAAFVYSINNSVCSRVLLSLLAGLFSPHPDDQSSGFRIIRSPRGASVYLSPNLSVPSLRSSCLVLSRSPRPHLAGGCRRIQRVRNLPLPPAFITVNQQHLFIAPRSIWSLWSQTFLMETKSVQTSLLKKKKICCIKRFYYYFFFVILKTLKTFCHPQYVCVINTVIHPYFHQPFMNLSKSCFLSTYHLLSAHLSLNRRLAGVNTFFLMFLTH